ncbi:DNA-3-methyladenine glycosylase family protein [Staphylococcus pasteuri]|uniref:DNA-3-methyladenine glycosylase family protein n=1 Tax=Staphylococcus pasteuri TaxID=45972 RepID=UPI0015E7002B|nr:DNA-3-methyladenine glycosylase 2 family protein [Staphylococcus pasteuri]
MSYSVSGYLYPKKPFDFEKSLEFLRTFSPGKNEQKIDENSLIKAVQLDNQCFVFSLSSVGEIEQPKISYELSSNEPIKKDMQKKMERNIGTFISIDDNLEEFYEVGKNDEKFKPILEKLYGYHQVRFFSAFENACWAILSTRTPMNLAKKMKRDLSEKYGAYLKYDNEFYLTFPDANSLESISIEDIEEVINNSQKAKYLKNVIEFFTQEDNESLVKKEYKKVKEELLKIKGIGEWSASFILLRGLGFMEELPTNEKVLREEVRKLYKNSDKEYEKLIDMYGDYIGYWAHYIRAYESMKGK